jgi:hypothetical protein
MFHWAVDKERCETSRDANAQGMTCYQFKANVPVKSEREIERNAKRIGA